MKNIKTKYATFFMLIGIIISIKTDAQNAYSTGGTALHLPFFKSIAGGYYNIENSEVYDNSAAVGSPAIGIGTPIPSTTLDISVGSINNAYGINGIPILQSWGTANIAVGEGAGYSNTSGTNNTFVGRYSGYHENGSYNTCLGSNAGINSTSSFFNVIIGYQAGALNTVDDNVFIGTQAGYNSIAGSSNAFVGTGSGYGNNNGTYNTFSGWGSGSFTFNGNRNCFYGNNSGENNNNGNCNSYFGSESGNQMTLIDNDSNVFVGHKSGYSNESNANTFAGVHSGYSNTNGKHNTYIGAYAGELITKGDLNTFLGFSSRVTTGFTVSNSTAVGANAEVTKSNTLILGDNSINVGIGLSADLVGPLAKLHVLRNVSNLLTIPTGVHVDNPDIDVAGPYTGSAIGVANFTNGTNRTNYGVVSLVTNAYSNIAAYFSTYNAATAQNCAGSFIAGFAPINFGVYSLAPNIGASTVFNVGVYGSAPNVIGTAPNTGSYAGYFNGNVAAMGYLPIPSDSSIKTNITLYKNSTKILKQINCYTFNYDSTKYGPHVNLPKSLQYGFMAQEVANAAPTLVINGNLPPKIDSLGNVFIQPQPVLMIDYIRMVPLLLGAFKEQQNNIDSLFNRISYLENIISQCCALNNQHNTERHSNDDFQTVELQNSEKSILYQNVPNPYNSATTIRYYIPDDNSVAKIIFNDNTGRTIKKITLTKKGEGAIEIDGSGLSSGIYSYSLFINDRVIDSKKMIRQ